MAQNAFSPGFQVPDDPTVELLVAVIYAESSSRGTGGEDPDEKEAIGWSFVNIAYYATYVAEGKKHNYNGDMGDGTILSAIKKKSLAYSSPMWKEIMNGTALKPRADLEKLDPGQRAHLEASVTAASAIGAHPAGPHTLETLDGRAPVAFNKAKDAPPSTRQEKIGHLGSHSFYGFKPGRESE